MTDLWQNGERPDLFVCETIYAGAGGVTRADPDGEFGGDDADTSIAWFAPPGKRVARAGDVIVAADNGEWAVFEVLEVARSAAVPGAVVARARRLDPPAP